MLLCWCCVESNAARAVGLGGVPVLLTMFSDWHKSDNRNRHIALRKSVLSVLKNVTNLSQSRTIVVNCYHCYQLSLCPVTNAFTHLLLCSRLIMQPS